MAGIIYFMVLVILGRITAQENPHNEPLDLHANEPRRPANDQALSYSDNAENQSVVDGIAVTPDARIDRSGAPYLADDTLDMLQKAKTSEEDRSASSNSFASSSSDSFSQASSKAQAFSSTQTNMEPSLFPQSDLPSVDSENLSPESNSFASAQSIADASSYSQAHPSLKSPIKAWSTVNTYSPVPFGKVYSHSQAQALSSPPNNMGPNILPNGLAPQNGNTLFQANAQPLSSQVNPYASSNSFTSAVSQAQNNLQNPTYPHQYHDVQQNEGYSPLTYYGGTTANTASASPQSASETIFLPQSNELEAGNSVAHSRVIMGDELVLLHNLPGGKKVACSFEGELHRVMLIGSPCMVCLCTRIEQRLQPACVSCAECLSDPPQDIPLPRPNNIPSFPIPNKDEILNPTTQKIESCAPLPEGRLFQNPLNPCQVCVCSSPPFGPVRIDCRESPQCVMPPDVIPIHALPDNGPQPQPLPDMLFTTPVPDQEQSSIVPVPEPDGNPLPLFPDSQIEVRPDESPLAPIPNIVDNPLPWPPGLKPGPLPGPPPHGSCQPFPPEMPFQHPWDECQLCKCSESQAQGIVNVEVTCYTKPSCCIILDDNEEKVTKYNQIDSQPALSFKHPEQLTMLDKICELKTFGVEFTDSRDSCKLCTCEIFGRFIVPVCKRSPTPQCRLRLQPSNIAEKMVVYVEPTCRAKVPHQPYTTGCHVCVCVTVYNYVLAKCSLLPNCKPREQLAYTVPTSLLDQQAVSYADASANANFLNNNFYKNNNMPPQIFGQEANSNAEAMAVTNPGLSNQGKHLYGNHNGPASLLGQQASLNAKATAFTNSGGSPYQSNNLYENYNVPPSDLGQQTSLSSVATAFTNSGSLNEKGNELYGNNNAPAAIMGQQPSSNAEAIAIANSEYQKNGMYGNVSPKTYNGLYGTLGNQYPLSEATATANSHYWNNHVYGNFNAPPPLFSQLGNSNAEAISAANSGNLYPNNYLMSQKYQGNKNLYNQDFRVPPYLLGQQAQSSAKATAVSIKSGDPLLNDPKSYSPNPYGLDRQSGAIGNSLISQLPESVDLRNADGSLNRVTRTTGPWSRVPIFRRFIGQRRFYG